jgi:hypothetical protein
MQSAVTCNTMQHATGAPSTSFVPSLRNGERIARHHVPVADPVPLHGA